MKDFGEKVPHWTSFANDFVFNMKENSSVASFVETVQTAKIEVERKMRMELDEKLMEMGVCPVYLALGEDLVKRLRFYIKMQSIKQSSHKLKHLAPELNKSTIKQSGSPGHFNLASIPETPSVTFLKHSSEEPKNSEKSKIGWRVSVSDEVAKVKAAKKA